MRILSLLALLLLASVGLAAPPDFDKQIAPLLASRCLDCHSGARPKGKLDLSRKAGAADMLVSGKPADSPLWQRVATGEMPPKKPLPAAERKLLKEWIASGAKWGTDPIDPFRFSTTSRAGYDWWALRPLQRPSIPVIRNPQVAPRNDIDRFIIAKLRDNGLSLTREADRRTLIRRVTFDLIGLPPTPEEVAAFIKDTSPDAYEKLVDRLLASPHYGERWARHWLDVVRFGESDGFERNEPRRTAYHYRNWVIRALNADLPYDEFARLQLAGDVLRPGDPDAVRATGFLVAGVHNTVFGNDQMRAIGRQDELEDLVGSVAQTFLGLTANCARCHDHKFDPISQKDYYRFQAALGGVGFGERPLPNAKASTEVARLKKELEETITRLTALEKPARDAALATKKSGTISAPVPLAAWDFRKGGDDLIGKLDAKPVGDVKFTPEGVAFDGKGAYLRTARLPFELKARTLEAWVKLSSLTQSGGGVITVETPDGNDFDSIVFAEREPARWMAGSEFFRRTKPFGGALEKEAAREFVHIAITYAADGTITAYRNGKPYGKSYGSKGPFTLPEGKGVVVFGCRHEAPGGNKMLAGTVRLARLYDRALSATDVESSFISGGGFVTDAEIDANLAPDGRAQRADLRKRGDRIASDIAAIRSRATVTKIYANVAQVAPVVRVLARGDLANPGAIVSPGGLAAVPGPSANFALAPNASDAERRKALAKWMTSPQNPLFARVIVNRMWHYHFGTGIVETPSDLGYNGGPPSHPKLLDWLVGEFVAHKNSLKSLHKLIVTSATYRQASVPRKDALAKDADNRLLWRFESHRLEGESVRDTMLAVSGLLNPAIGGKGFSDYKERNYNGTVYFEPFDPVGPEFHRRSVYRFTPRGANQGLLDAFDCPDPAAAAPRRAITTTPLQALTLWNNGFALRASKELASRVAKEAQGVDAQIRRAWQLVYQRDPTAEETKLAAALVKEHGMKALCRVLFNSNEFITVE